MPDGIVPFPDAVERANRHAPSDEFKAHVEQTQGYVPEVHDSQYIGAIIQLFEAVNLDREEAMDVVHEIITGTPYEQLSRKDIISSTMFEDVKQLLAAMKAQTESDTTEGFPDIDFTDEELTALADLPTVDESNIVRNGEIIDLNSRRKSGDQE